MASKSKAAKPKPKTGAKRTGPSGRTQAERDAINKRAAAWKPSGKIATKAATKPAIKSGRPAVIKPAKAKFGAIKGAPEQPSGWLGGTVTFDERAQPRRLAA